ncbi:MAG: barstar family protein [Faecousia sp.]
MDMITIDCGSFTCLGDLHRAFAQCLSFPACYGHNLDALHDCLTDISRETRLRLLHWEAAEAALGPGTKRVILHAALENPNLAVIFD